MTLIQPFFDYCCSSWYSGVNTKLKDRLDALQRKMIRFVFRLDSRDSVMPDHFRQLGWLCVSDRVRYFKMVITFKVRMGQAPSYLSDCFQRFSTVHSYETRGSQSDYIVSREDTASSAMLNSFTYTAKKEWNRLPSSLKTIRKLEVFKSKLRDYLLAS